MSAFVAALIGAVGIWILLFGIVGLSVAWDEMPEDAHVVIGYTIAIIVITGIGVGAALILYTAW